MINSLEIVAQIEILLEDLKKSLGVKLPKSAVEPSRREAPVEVFSGLTGSIYNLVKEDFFKVPRAISEIQTKLRLEGVVAPTTSLSGPLLLLIRKKILSRNKPDGGKGTFRYQQR